MLSPADIVTSLKQRNLGPYIGVPCSFLKSLINCLIDHEPGDYLAVNNEGEAIAVAAGAALAGRRPVVMFQNSGLGNAVNPLTSLSQVFGIPVLIITTLRGDPAGQDEPQHRLMGRITERLLTLMEIPFGYFPQRESELAAGFDAATGYLDAGSAYALIMRKDTLFAYNPRQVENRSTLEGAPELRAGGHGATLVLRRDALRTIMASISADTLVIATTGKTARELYEHHEREENLYLVGSMGCASSVAFGVARHQPGRRVMILDGDGAALMRLEAMATIGHYAPVNLTHVVLDNQCYESTGGQRTLSPSVDFPSLATACGYRTACASDATQSLAELIAKAGRTAGPHFIHFRIRPGSDPDLPRPVLEPAEVAFRFRAAACSWQKASPRDFLSGAGRP